MTNDCMTIAEFTPKEQAQLPGWCASVFEIEIISFLGKILIPTQYNSVELIESLKLDSYCCVTQRSAATPYTAD